MNKTFDKIKFQFLPINAAVAADYLAKSTGNRRLKESTVETYARDMANGEWLTNHQGVAVDEDGRLIDGHHRLNAVVKSRATVTMLVSTGWPVKPKNTQATTMDTVDRGCVRSLRDQLELQHGITNAKDIVQLSAALTAIIAGHLRASKQSTSTILRIVELYQPQFQWFSENACRQQGLRNVTLSAVVILGLVANEKKTREFYEALKTGLNLSATSPVYHLRNYALALRGGHDYDEKIRLRQASAHHLALHIAGKPASNVVHNSTVALQQLIAAQGERAKIICGLWGGEPEKAAVAEPTTMGKRFDSAEAVKVLNDLRGRSFSATDLRARVDGGDAQASAWITSWYQQGWVTTVGVKEFRATEKAPKSGV
jgi:hypothetical protein